nr:hypothetical protein [Candidatus Saccharibacteria bacterium]NIV03892.1 hypothetical protein [Calditrichia bacterium]NIV72223.1 hypothetical protein [Calditrichia bacterium]NIV98611.1 hypothetical protein [Candidatus Saccharibacteria bacterium]NIW79468.1 hypothetical protein [Calditrichia bacterium]
MKKFIFWPSIGLLTFIFTLLFSGSSIAQVDRVRDLVTENHPSISELENRYGKLILTDE